MDLDIFFSSPRWKVLEILAKKPSSPLEISLELRTSVAYVSQQLKLLEAANLVVKEKTGSAEKGKPRSLFSLSDEILHLTALIKNYPSKKLIYLTDYHKLILKIWLLEDVGLHYYVEKFYWLIESEIENVEGLFVDLSSAKAKILVVSDSKKLKPKVDLFLKSHRSKIDCNIISDSDLKKISSEKLHVIYDPKFLFVDGKLKGGKSQQDE